LPREVITPFKTSNERSFLDLQSKAFNGVVCLPRVSRNLKYLDHQGSFIATRDGSTVGCVGLYKLEPRGWYEIGNLALRNDMHMNLARSLVGRVLQHISSKHPTYLKASTPSIQPYVDVYKEAGFKPVRLILDISWDLRKVKLHADGTNLKTRNLTKRFANEAGLVWVEGLRPYWDWWIEEAGGPRKLRAWVKKSIVKGEIWIGAFLEGKMVGLTYLRPDLYGKGRAWFNGIYVLPGHRGRGFGSHLMNSLIREAWTLKQTKLSIYTLAFLDHLAPGAILYLKSGGRIEAEHLELQKALD
jgi:GNAT superfamily N-acetyltransferase